MNTTYPLHPQSPSALAHPFHRVTAALAAVLLLLGSVASLPAQSSPTGSLRGKVFNPSTGNYLEGAAVAEGAPPGRLVRRERPATGADATSASSGVCSSACPALANRSLSSPPLTSHS
jgi:hypothetical protein